MEGFFPTLISLALALLLSLAFGRIAPRVGIATSTLRKLNAGTLRPSANMTRKLRALQREISNNRLSRAGAPANIRRARTACWLRLGKGTMPFLLQMAADSLSS